MTWPDRISVYHKLRFAPTQSSNSFILDVLILSERHQRAAARCEEDIVVYNYGEGGKTILPTFIADAFQDTFVAQEKARMQSRTKVLNVLQQVEKLEKSSWNRPDAVEALGT